MNRIVIVAMIVMSLAMFAVGYIYRGASSAKGVIKQQQKDANEVVKHEENQKVVTQYVDRIKVVIRKVPDPTGCLDTDVPDVFHDSLLDADRKTKP